MADPNLEKRWLGISRAWWQPSKPDNYLETDQKVRPVVTLSDWSVLDPSPRVKRLTYNYANPSGIIGGIAQNFYQIQNVLIESIGIVQTAISTSAPAIQAVGFFIDNTPPQAADATIFPRVTQRDDETDQTLYPVPVFDSSTQATFEWSDMPEIVIPPARRRVWGPDGDGVSLSIAVVLESNTQVLANVLTWVITGVLLRNDVGQNLLLNPYR